MGKISRRRGTVKTEIGRALSSGKNGDAFMRTRRTRPGATSRLAGAARLAACAIVLSGVAFGALAAQSAHPDLSGNWLKRGRNAQGEETPPPMTPEGQRIYARNKAAVANSDPDINIALKCLPPGFPRIALAVNPFSLLQTPKIVGIIAESGRPQMIYMDRPHRKLWPTFYGDSVGHWEGDTLVVDVTDVRDVTFFDLEGLPHSDALHVIERFKLVDGGKSLQNDMTIEDPKIFTKTWLIKVIYDRQSDDNLPIENVCENTRLKP